MACRKTAQNKWNVSSKDYLLMLLVWIIYIKFVVYIFSFWEKAECVLMTKDDCPQNLSSELVLPCTKKLWRWHLDYFCFQQDFLFLTNASTSDAKDPSHRILRATLQKLQVKICYKLSPWSSQTQTIKITLHKANRSKTKQIQRTF